MALDVPAYVPEQLRAIGEEASRVEENARYSAQGQFEQAKIWRAVNLALGIPAAALAAVAGGRALASAGNPLLSASLSLAAAALTAALTTVNAARRAEQANSTANTYLDIRTRARQLLLIDLSELNFEDARDRLSQLTDRYSEVSASAEPPPSIAYRRAKKNIERGRQDHLVDRLRQE